MPGEEFRIMFPPAPQPDVVRSGQKDDYYKRLLYDKYFDLSQHYLGMILEVISLFSIYNVLFLLLRSKKHNEFERRVKALF